MSYLRPPDPGPTLAPPWLYPMPWAVSSRLVRQAHNRLCAAPCRYLTLNATESFCTSEFGIDASTVARNVAQTNAWYGGRQLAGTCLLYPNGEVDPWSSQSILNSTAPGVACLLGFSVYLL